MKLIGYVAELDARLLETKPRHNGTAAVAFSFKAWPTEISTVPFFVGATTFDDIKTAVAHLTEAQRLELFGDYCAGCGGPCKCNCWRDD